MNIRKLKNAVDFTAIAKYAAVFALMTVFCRLIAEPQPFQIALLTAFLAMNFSIFITPALFVLSFLAAGGSSLLASASIGGAFITAVFDLPRDGRQTARGDRALFSRGFYPLFSHDRLRSVREDSGHRRYRGAHRRFAARLSVRARQKAEI